MNNKSKMTKTVSKDASQKEEDDLARAIELSLNEAKSTSMVSKSRSEPSSLATITSTPLYPSTTGAAPDRVVKALYDFEAAEDNELTFRAGEHITILDDRDMNWWKGKNQRGVGLFPASFVTADLTAKVEQEVGGRKVQFDDTVQVEEVPRKETPEEVKIDEEKLNACLELLKDADPTGDRPDPADLAPLEESCLGMGPLIDAELASVDRETNLLAEVDVKLRDALALYNSAMQEATNNLHAQMAAASMGSPQYYSPQPGGQAPQPQYHQYSVTSLPSLPALHPFPLPQTSMGSPQYYSPQPGGQAPQPQYHQYSVTSLPSLPALHPFPLPQTSMGSPQYYSPQPGGQAPQPQYHQYSTQSLDAYAQQYAPNSIPQAASIPAYGASTVQGVSYAPPPPSYSQQQPTSYVHQQ